VKNVLNRLNWPSLLLGSGGDSDREDINLRGLLGLRGLFQPIRMRSLACQELKMIHNGLKIWLYEPPQPQQPQHQLRIKKRIRASLDSLSRTSVAISAQSDDR